jgi:hypothetical protein
LNRRTPRAGRSAFCSLTLALLWLVTAATIAEAGSTKAAFSVSATVVANCATRGLTVACTRGVASPRTATVRGETSESAATAQGLPSTSQADLPRMTTVVTINF